jgi:hypothetical protein
MAIVLYGDLRNVFFFVRVGMYSSNQRDYRTKRNKVKKQTIKWPTHQPRQENKLATNHLSHQRTRTAFLWDITQHPVRVLHRRFETTYRPHLPGSFYSSLTSWPLKMRPISCPETSVQNYQPNLRNISEERRADLQSWRKSEMTSHSMSIPINHWRINNKFNWYSFVKWQELYPFITHRECSFSISLHSSRFSPNLLMHAGRMRSHMSLAPLHRAAIQRHR